MLADTFATTPRYHPLSHLPSIDEQSFTDALNENFMGLWPTYESVLLEGVHIPLD